MPNIPAQIARGMKAQGGPVAISLLELQTPGGIRLFVSDAPCVAPSVLAQFDGASSGGSSGGGIVHYNHLLGFAGDTITAPAFQPWLVDPPPWTFTGLLTTATSQCTIQNLSGDTVQRTNALLLRQHNLFGSNFVYRLWNVAAEYALITVKGNVADAFVNGKTAQLQLRGICNWSEIPAPDCTVDENCGNIFGSPQCGSTSSVPCQNNYGSCTQKLRFKGVVAQWNGSTTSSANAVGVAQPVPVVSANLRRPA